MENNFSDIQRGADKLLDGITEKVKQLDVKIGELNANVVKLLSTPANSSGLTTQVKTLETEITKLNTTIGKQQTQLNKLSELKRKSNRDSLIENDTRKKSLSSLKLQVTANNKLASSYERLVAQQKRMKMELDRLTASYGKNSKEALRMQSAYDKATGKTNKANKAFLSFSKGGIRGAIGGIRSLAGAFGILGGGAVLASLIPNIFNLTKQFDAFRFAMSKTIPDTLELAATQKFLDETTQNFGADLVTTTERYIKFDAAARQSNLSLESTQKIFGTVTKAAGVLGLKTDELQGVYLALEQMLSKGKVTTEELRRQLGERLPGAFGIMADAIGVSTSKLDDMLKKGEILSADALPKFAIQLEKAYGIESVTKVNTLQAAQTRLSNSWAMFVRDITGDDSILQGTFRGVLNFMSNLLDGIKSVSDEIKDAFKSEATKALESDLSIINERINENVRKLRTWTNEQERTYKALNLLGSAAEKLEKDIQSVQPNRNIADIADSVKELEKTARESKSWQEFRDTFGKTPFVDVNKLAAFYIAVQSANKVLKESNQTVSDAEDGRRTLADVLREIEDLQLKLKDSTVEESATINAKIKVLQKEADQWKDIKDSREKIVALSRHDEAEGVRSFKKEIEGLISILEKTKDLYIENSVEARLLQKQIDDLKETISPATSEVEEFFETWENGQKAMKLTKDKLKEAKDSLADFFGEFQDEFFSEAGFDKLNEFFFKLDKEGKSMFDNLIENADEGIEKFGVYFNTITEIAQEAFNFINQQSQASFNAEYERLEQQRDIALQFAGESTAAQEQIQEQYEARRKAIQQRQARSQKQQAIFNTIINTAQGVVSALASTPPNPVLSAIIAGIGASQIALIASTPLPEFFRGTQNAPEGWALVDEKQPEVHTDRHGNVKSMGENKANHRYLSAGDKIYKSHEEWINKEFKDVIHGNDIITYNEAMSQTPTVVVKDNGFTASQMDSIIAKHFSNIKTQNTIIDKNGVQTYISKGNSRTIELNNRVSFKGISV